MKVCFLITGLGIGGAERHLFNIVPRLNFENFIISLTDNDEFGKKIEEKGVKVYYLGLNKYNLPFVILKFRKIIKEEKPDVLDTYLIHSNLFGRIFGNLFGVKKNISSVRSDYSRFKLLKMIDKITKNLVDLFILNSKALLFYVHNTNQVKMENIKVIPNGIDLKNLYSKIDNNYDIRLDLKLEMDHFIIISTVRLIKDKNINVLIKAMKFVDENICLVIVGDGPERDNLLNLVNRLNLNERIYFLGVRHDIPNLLNSADIFILPSVREGMSNALLEAMALKKICIVSNIPQNKELINDGYNGLTFNPQSEKELALKIQEVYEEKSKFKTFGFESFNIIEKKFNMKRIAKSYEETINSLI